MSCTRAVLTVDAEEELTRFGSLLLYLSPSYWIVPNIHEKGVVMKPPTTPGRFPHLHDKKSRGFRERQRGRMIKTITWSQQDLITDMTDMQGATSKSLIIAQITKLQRCKDSCCSDFLRLNVYAADWIVHFRRDGEKGRSCLIQSMTRGYLVAIVFAGGYSCFGAFSSFSAAAKY